MKSNNECQKPSLKHISWKTILNFILKYDQTTNNIMVIT